MLKKKKPNPVGRPSKYNPIYCQQILAYFEIEPSLYKDITYTYKNGDTRESSEEEAAPLPTFRKFARSIGTYHDVLLNWCKKFPEFATAYNRAKEAQKEFIIENAIRDNYSGYFAGLMMKNMFGWRDSKESPKNEPLNFETYFIEFIRKHNVELKDRGIDGVRIAKIEHRALDKFLQK